MQFRSKPPICYENFSFSQLNLLCYIAKVILPIYENFDFVSFPERSKPIKDKPIQGGVPRGIKHCFLNAVTPWLPGVLFKFEPQDSIGSLNYNVLMLHFSTQDFPFPIYVQDFFEMKDLVASKDSS